jgi:hypothetical protein
MDILNLHAEDSIFLQQASHLTHGIYYRVRRKDGLLQYLNVSLSGLTFGVHCDAHPVVLAAYFPSITGHKKTARLAVSGQGGL